MLGVTSAPLGAPRRYVCALTTPRHFLPLKKQYTPPFTSLATQLELARSQSLPAAPVATPTVHTHITVTLTFRSSPVPKKNQHNQ